MDDDTSPTAHGLLQCLRVLSEEAACLSLTRTFAALQDAVAICEAEAEAAPAKSAPATGYGLVH